jgi:hypothetical protein
VSFTFRQAEGTRTTTRNIVTIVAGVLTPNLDLTTARVGDIVELFGATVVAAGNAGFYTITAITVNAGADNYTLRPAPNNMGAAATACARLNRATEYAIAAAATTSIAVLTGGLALVQVTGANFRTLDVRPNDRMTMIGNAIAANNGAWGVQEVVSDDFLVVRPPDGNAAATMAAEAVGTGAITIRMGVHVIAVTDEATLTLDTILSIGVPLNGPSGGAPFFGSGDIRDYFRRRPVGSGGALYPRQMCVMEGLGSWAWNQAGLGGGSTFTFENDIFIDGKSDVSGAGVVLGTPQWNKTGTWAGSLTITLGSTTGDPNAADEGCVLVGIRSGPTLQVRGFAYGSYSDGTSGLGFNANDGTVVGSVVRGSIGLGSGTGGTIESVAVYGDQPVLVGGTPGINNLLITSSAGSIGVTNPATFGGLLISSDIAFPAFIYSYNTDTTPMVVLDPREDYDITSIIDFTFTNRFAEKRYTFNPRFVLPTVPPTPVDALAVVITEINEDDFSEIEVFNDVTDIDGRLNAGAGVVLRRQSSTGTTPVGTNFTHRMDLVSGSSNFQIIAHFEGDLSSLVGGDTTLITTSQEVVVLLQDTTLEVNLTPAEIVVVLE